MENQMTIKYNERDEKGERKSVILNKKRITIQCNEIDYHIQINQFGEIVITKSNFGKGSDSIIIQPCVSNQIIIS